ncbi:hypothetical protein JAAARDRAFT_196696 [Jaapia argillacea MUCL 33604]|uniref:Uncharacterized protein n=1 Tax=Jaapia argillacea MUCL 33604 TaxID=933084 RepID=A0A067PKF4_9AGAM|nr:hypothetical protein JAAARDRAFT_196696 [Jaapia argillacea MUCL 33604]
MCGERSYHASLSSLWIEALLYGAYLPLFLGSAYICTYTRPNKYLLALATVMFGLCTVQGLLDFATALYTPEIVANTVCAGGVCLGCDGETESRVSQINIQSLLGVVANVGYTLNQLMADGLLVYRTFVLWESSIWVVVIPTAGYGFFQTFLAYRVYCIRLNAPLNETTPPPEWVALTDLGFTFVAIEGALMTTTNVLTTALIASRIWWMTRDLRSVLGGRATRKYRRVLTMIVEHGGIYTMSIVARLSLLYVFPDDFDSIPQVIESQLTGINPTLLIIMLGLEKSIDHTMFSYSNVINIVPSVSQAPQVGSPVPLSDSNGIVD